MQTKTRAIRLSDETWNELERLANQGKLRGRAEYLEMLCSGNAPRPPKPTISEIRAYWSEKWQGKWDLDGLKGKPFNEMIIDTIYEHWILNHDH